MSQDKQENEFERYLEGDSDISSAYQSASSEQPAAHLDEAILAASRRAVASKPRRVFSPFSSDWQLPLSIAAVMVLSVTVIVSMQYDEDEVYLKEPLEHRTEAVSEILLDQLSSPGPSAELSSMEARANSEQEVLATEFDTGFDEQSKLRAPKASLEGTTQSLEISRKRTMKNEMVFPDVQSQMIMSDRLDEPASDNDAFAASPRDISAADKPASIFKEDSKDRQREFKKNEAQEEISNLPSAAVSLDRVGRTKTRSELLLKQSASGAYASPSKMNLDDQSSPEKWLALIEQLWVDGHSAEAINQFRNFKKQFPDFDENIIENTLDNHLRDAVKNSQ